ncbi:MAG: SIMPL domain-containing protein [Dehalococcoidales bacterium]|nr:SIMPL domain-containing protein [Dehalococcoidales bacterium]
MKKNWLWIIAVGLVAILAAPFLAGCSLPAEARDTTKVNISQQQEGIWVTGTGEISINPDIAILSLGVSVMEKNVATALSEASEAMAKVMQALTENGIEQKDIQTGHFSINQRTRWDDEKQIDSPTGYQVTNMVTVKIHDTGNAGTIIDSVVQAGGDLIRINGISFSVEEPAKYYTEVREKAMTAARNKAEELAELAGLTLGKPSYIAENAQYSPVYGGYSNVAVAMAVPEALYSSSSISTGETKITLNIQVAYSVTQ